MCFRFCFTKFQISSLLAGVEFGKSIVVPSEGWIVFGRLGNTLEKAQWLTSLDADWIEWSYLYSGDNSFKTSQCIFQVYITKQFHFSLKEEEKTQIQQ